MIALPFKYATEGLVLLSWNVVYGRDYFSSEKITSDKIKPGLELIDSAVLAMRDPTGGPRQQRVERLLNELRPFSYSSMMSACYSVAVTESTQFNGFNTGCHIFVTRQMVDLLNDDQLRAVLAHEMSHGEVGDLVRTYGSIAREFFAHVRILMGEEMIWAVTGEVQPYNQKILDAVQKPGDSHLAAQMQMIMQAFSQTAERVEIRADVNATKILARSGHSGEDLVSALELLTKAAFEEKQKRGGAVANKDVRGYPKLQTRISAIRFSELPAR
jgi:predicted Zn-dependent protease